MKYDFDLDLQTNNSLSNIISRIQPNSKILEFGCANGRLTKYLKETMDCQMTIVEIEYEAGKEASQYAELSCLGNDEGDIEKLIWCEKLEKNSYDYIIFADVLEHLHHPKDILNVCKEYIKDSGSILVSIPNVANNCVIANLLRDRFDYTKVGLLDDTHLTFFTRISFETMVRELGLYLTYESATYTNIGNNEVPIAYSDIPTETKKILLQRDYGDVYQYIFEISKVEKETINDLKTNVNKYFVSNIIYKYAGEDLNPENIDNIPTNFGSNQIEWHKSFEDKTIDLIRFTPVATNCIIKINEIKMNNSCIDLKKLSHNASYVYNNCYIYDNNGPYFYIPVDNEKEIILYIDFEILDFDMMSERNLQILLSSIHERNIAVDEMNQKINEKNNEIIQVHSELAKMISQYQNMTNQYQYAWQQYLNANEKAAISQRRLDSIKKRSLPIWRWLDKYNPLRMTPHIDYHIDDVVVSKFKIYVRGWAYHNEGKDYKIRGKVFKKKRYIRSDVNKLKLMNADYQSGFDLTLCPLFPIDIKFVCDDGKNIYHINALKLYLKYWKGMFVKLQKSFEYRGVKQTLKLCFYKLIGKRSSFVDSYDQWFFKHRVTKEELKKQKEHHFSYEPLISIVVPTYNTPVKLLNEMIQSIKDQSYSNWELCIADGASQNKETLNYLKKLESTDSRVKVKFLKENYMISGNTNEAIQMVTGEFVALMDHDDLIEPDALYEFVKLLNEQPELDFIYTDEDKINEDSTHYMIPHFKPDFSIDNLRNYNYITHFSLIRKSVLDAVGLFDSKCDGAQDYDMFLRICDYTKNIGHIAKILYHWRICENSTAQDISTKSYVMEAGKYALRKHLERNHIKGTVVDGLEPTLYKVNYEILNNPKISIIICTKDHIDDLDKCISSILNKSTYDNYEIIVVENNSEEKETFEYYKQLELNSKIKIVYFEGEFNYSAVNNFGEKYATGEYILLLNNDVEVITPNWLEEMLMYAQREDVGAVGCKLLYPDDTIQHAGIIVGLGGVAAHSHRGYPADSVGYVGRLIVSQDLSAVTAACLMVKKSIFEEVGGLSEKYKVTYNDVDFCLRIREKGYLNVMNPFAQLYHYESKSRGLEDTSEKYQRFMNEQAMFKEDWHEILENGDPYYNPNLTLSAEDFSLKQF